MPTKKDDQLITLLQKQNNIYSAISFSAKGNKI